MTHDAARDAAAYARDGAAPEAVATQPDSVAPPHLAARATTNATAAGAAAVEPPPGQPQPAAGELMPAFDPQQPGVQADPYHAYAHYRAREPRHWSPLPERPGPGRWFLFSYADVAAALTDPALGRERPDRQACTDQRPFFELISRMMLFRDAPVHDRMKGAFADALSPAAVRRLRGRVETLCEALLARLDGDDSFDLVAEVAAPLPVLVIAELLGVPEADRHLLTQWSKTLSAALDAGQCPDILDDADRMSLEFSAYLEGVVEQRTARPGDDLISRLLALPVEQRLTSEELIANCVLMLSAGHETTTNLISSGVVSLLEHPDQLELLRRRPKLIGSAVEECLRYESPIQLTVRIVQRPTPLCPDFEPGQAVDLVIGSANRDEAAYEEPTRFDITRKPNRHLAFGCGEHYCVGAQLTRIEAEVAFRAIFKRWPRLRLAEAPLEWRASAAFRGPVSVVLET